VFTLHSVTCCRAASSVTVPNTVSVCVCLYVCVDVQVTFLNEKTGEYQFYEVTFRSIKPSALSVITLATAVRMRKQHSITVDNPLPTPANLSCTSTVADIIIPAQFSVQPESTVLHCTFSACSLTPRRRYTGARPGWKIHRPGSSPGSALPSPAYCFASVIV